MVDHKPVEQNQEPIDSGGIDEDRERICFYTVVDKNNGRSLQ